MSLNKFSSYWKAFTVMCLFPPKMRRCSDELIRRCLLLTSAGTHPVDVVSGWKCLITFLFLFLEKSSLDLLKTNDLYVNMTRSVTGQSSHPRLSQNWLTGRDWRVWWETCMSWKVFKLQFGTFSWCHDSLLEPTKEMDPNAGLKAEETKIFIELKVLLRQEKEGTELKK